MVEKTTKTDTEVVKETVKEITKTDKKSTKVAKKAIKAEKKIAKAEKKASKAVKKKPVERDMKKIAAEYKGDPFDVIRYVVMTERAIQMIEIDNKLVFVVDKNSSKRDVKKAIEATFETPVSKVNLMNDQRGRKKAFIKLAKPEAAGEIAIRLGII